MLNFYAVEYGCTYYIRLFVKSEMFLKRQRYLRLFDFFSVYFLQIKRFRVAVTLSGRFTAQH